jgi:hypothetical protein
MNVASEQQLYYIDNKAFVWHNQIEKGRGIVVEAVPFEGYSNAYAIESVLYLEKFHITLYTALMWYAALDMALGVALENVQIGKGDGVGLFVVGWAMIMFLWGEHMFKEAEGLGNKIMWLLALGVYLLAFAASILGFFR